MRAVTLHAFDGELSSLRVEERPVPSLRPGDLLVRIGAAPVNPSDLLFLRDRYGATKTLPAVPGWEGMGVVVEASSLAGRALVGRRVAVAIAGDESGTWAEYVRAPLAQCVPLLPATTDEQGAMLIVNPLTAWALLDLAREGGHAALVQTAAASALGRMIASGARRAGLPVVHVVRRAEQVALLRAQGAEHVLDSTSEHFAESLRDLAHGLRATLLLDAVGGPLTRVITRVLPPRSTAIVYGALDDAPAELSQLDLIFRGLRAHGFYLADWLQDAGMPKILRAAIAVQSNPDYRSVVRARVGFDGFVDALRSYTGRMTEGKVLLTP